VDDGCRTHMTDGHDEDAGPQIAECMTCAQATEHEVLRRTPRGSGVDVLARCIECSKVQTVVIRPPKAVRLIFTLSEGASSKAEEIEVDEDEVLAVGEIFEWGSAHWEITRIDGAGSRPRKSLPATEIVAAWAVRSDRVTVRLTMTEGEDSSSGALECSPGQVFSCGNVIEVEGRPWRIRALHTGKGRTLRGTRAAADLRRIYLHPIDSD